MSDKGSSTAASSREIPPRLVRIRRVAGFGAAGAMFLYLVVKVAWVVGASNGAVPHEFDSSLPEWIALNTVTIGMAALGVMLGLALAQPWGKRIPAPLVIVFAWTAGGFLISLLPYSALSALLAAAGIRSSGEPTTESGDQGLPSWETTLITIGFAGMAIGLLIAGPIYMRERWPRAFTGTTGDARTAARHPRTLPALGLAATIVPTTLWTYWAVGGTVGLNPAAHELWNLDARLLVGTSAVWAVLGGWGVWALSGPGLGRVPLWLPMTVGFVASGSLLAWNAWRIIWVILPITGQEPLKAPVAAVVEHGTAMAAGLLLLAFLLRAYRNNLVPRGVRHRQLEE